VEAAPANPFDLPTTPIRAVLGDDANQTGLARMVKTSGVVTYKDQLLLFVQDGQDALRVYLRKDADVRPGDLVEVAGLPEPDGFSPKLSQAQARKTGTGTFPPLNSIDLMADNSSHEGNHSDATRCQIVGTYLGHSLEGTEPSLNLQDEATKQTFTAHLPDDIRPFSLPPPGSRVRLQGVFKAKMDAVLDYDQAATAFEMYLSSPDDLIVLQRPSWWSIRHTFWVLGGLGVVLSFSIIWIRLLRKQVQQRTHELREEIEQRKRVEAQVEKTHQKLVLVSRQAGMAEVATNVLHNVGNVLNSVNVSSLLIADKIRNSRIANLAKIVTLVREHKNELGNFFANDPKGRQLPDYLANLAAHLTLEQESVLSEIGSLVGNIDHIKEIVAMQQGYAKSSGIVETLQVAELVEDAIRLNQDSMIRHHVNVVREFTAAPPVSTDKHKVIQILVNLIRNAKNACDDSDREDKQITLRITSENHHIQIAVIDNGVGIPKENLTRIFNHGFTTRKDGHGFGLHSGALAAKEIGGSLGVFREGPGCGAAFTLELPLPEPGR
jgi:signal transduction histidine kinase